MKVFDLFLGYAKNFVLITLLCLYSAPFLCAEPHENTIRILREYADSIRIISQQWDVPVRLLVSAIYADRRMNYNLLDDNLDISIARAGRNNSIGFAQIRVSTAIWVEQVLNDTTNAYFPGDKYSKLIQSTKSRDDLITKLAGISTNLRYAAAYSIVILSRWKRAGYPINGAVAIFATLYNLGPYRDDGTERTPHANPQPNEYGIVAQTFYNSGLLNSIFPAIHKQ